MTIVLCSASPRRKELLRRIVSEFTVRTAQTDENIQEADCEQRVQALALRKARAVVMQAGEVLLGADTLVCLGTEILGKPCDRADAARMLRLLSGQVHQVYTGVALRSAERESVFCERTDVQFAPISEEELQRYLDEAAFLDKAGAYAIQEEGARFVTRIEGCPSNVVGLPVQRVYAALREFGLSEK